jgi:hypothetical protein
VVPWERDDGELFTGTRSSTRPAMFTPWASRSWC